MPRKIPKQKKPPPKEGKKLRLLEFIELWSSGYSKEEIVVMMDLGPNEFEALYNRCIGETEQDVNDKKPLRLFAEYVIKQSQLVRDLEALKTALSNANWKNGQAYVQAVRTQSEIMDKIIKTGQELAVIEKVAEQVHIVDGRDIRDLTDYELEQQVRTEMQAVQDILNKDGKRRGGKLIVLYPDKRQAEGGDNSA